MIFAGRHEAALARHLAHRSKERKSSVGVGDVFIRDADDLVLHELEALLGMRRGMDIGEQYLSLVITAVLVRKDLLDLVDHLGGIDRVGVDYLRSDLFVILVEESGALAGVLLNENGVSRANELGDCVRNGGYAELP